MATTPLLFNNRFLRVNEGKFPEAFSKRISVGSQKGKKFEFGVSPKGKIAVKLGRHKKVLRKGKKQR